MLVTIQTKASSKSGIRLRPIALPVEHGGWGLLFEPIVLGLLLAPSFGGFAIAIGAITAFLTRQPLKLLMVDFLGRRGSPRALPAKRFVILYSLITLVSFGVAFIVAKPNIFLPLLVAAPLAIVQLIYDARGKSRALLPELAGAVSLGAIGSAIAVSGGWPYAEAFCLWLIVSARALPSTLYVRARLNLIHHRPASVFSAITAHVTAVLILMAVAWNNLVPWLAVIAFAVLLLRAIVGLSAAREGTTAKQIGLREVVYGAVIVAAAWLGYRFGW